jgi:hypothetical protein
MSIQQHAPIAAPLIALAWILIRHRRRVIRPARLWILPAAFLAGAGALIGSHLPGTAVLYAGLFVAFGLGAVVGRWRVSLRRLDVDDAGRIISRPSPAALILVLSLFAVRYGLRAGAEGPLHLDVVVLTDVLLAFAVGLVCSDRLHLYRRCRALAAPQAT